MAKIVIVDDSRYLANKMKIWLESEGHNILAIGEDGIQGEELYIQHKPDLIILDITMPMRDGKECLENIMDQDPNANALMVSALMDKDIIVSCLKMGAKNYIQKPLELENEDFCSDFRFAIESAME